MNEQDEFAAVIEKYNLWEKSFFTNALPDTINLYKEYDLMLDETNPVQVNGFEWRYSDILKEKDEIMYKCGFADYTDVFRENYFERNDEEFYPVEGMRDAINEALDEIAATVTNDQL